MGKFNLSKKLILFIFAITSVIIFAIMAYAQKIGSGRYAFNDVVKPILYNTGWTLYEEGKEPREVTLPINDKSFGDTPVVVGRYLTEGECISAQTIMFYSDCMEVEVTVDDKVIYSLGKPNGDFVEFPPPTLFNFITLKSEYAGKLLKIKTLGQVAETQGTFGDVYIGDTGSEYVMLAKKNASAITVSAVLFGMGFIFIVMWIMLELKKKNAERSSALLWMAVISFLYLFWSMIGTRTLLLMFNGEVLFTAYRYLWFPLMEMAVLACFMENEYALVSKVSRRMFFIPIVNLIFSFLYLFFRWGDTEVVYMVSLGFIFIMSGVVIFATIKSHLTMVRRQEAMKYSFSMEFIGFIIVLVTVVIDLCRYYFFNIGDMDFQFSRLGLLILIACYGFTQLRHTIDINAALLQSKEYKNMALHDGLTNLGNRHAYQDRLNRLNNSLTGRSKTIVAIFDVNNLKQKNDSEGHEVGDKYIKDCAYFINSFFRDFATLYRIGGDEFAIICSLDDKKRFYTAYSEMEEKFKEIDLDEINFAYGYAEFDHEEDSDLYDTVRRADRMMYECKMKMKKNGIAVIR